MPKTLVLMWFILVMRRTLVIMVLDVVAMFRTSCFLEMLQCEHPSSMFSCVWSVLHLKAIKICLKFKRQNYMKSVYFAKQIRMRW